MHTARPNSILPESFYARDTVTVARDLLGKVLEAGGRRAAIVEVEAYLGLDDKAAHASRGLTPRTRVIYGPPGRAYIYLVYGLHECLNLIAEPDGIPGCVLIRAVEGVSGPGRLTRHFGITRASNGIPVFEPGGPIRVLDLGWRPESISTTPRIGIRHCADWPMRFLATRLIRSN